MSKETKQAEEHRGLFGKSNYQLMIAGVVIIVIGFLLMMGGGGNDAARFDPNEVYSFRRITLAPLVILIGLLLEVFAIMRRPKQ